MVMRFTLMLLPFQLPTSLNRKATYSNWGGEVSVCAPSNNFHPLDPQALVPGRGIWTTDNEQHGLGFTGGSRFTGNFGGTSSATPLVAGVAALVISANLQLSANEVKQILQETADKIEDLEPDTVLGLQKGSYDANGHSEWFGFGKVNAARAVQRAKELNPEEPEINNLDIGTTTNGSLAQTGSVQLFKVNVGSKLTASLEGPQNKDFDLYIKQGSTPTTQDYDAVGYSSSANEKVVIESTEPGEYYIMVRSYQGGGDFSLKCNLES